MKRALLLGATSAIAHETSRLLAADGYELALVARDKARLDILAPDLRVRGAPLVRVFCFDALEIDSHQHAMQQALESLGGVDLALIFQGSLPDQVRCQGSIGYTEESLKVNLLSPIACITWLANYFEKQASGSLVVISSVAGDRGRPSNYVYGAAKAGLSAFTDGVRGRLAKSGVQVLLVKPGFVESPMTAHLEKGPLFVGPEVVAKDILRAIKHKKDTLYTPWFWRWIMLIICSIPEKIFKRLKL